ncbi:set domain-containing protein [Diplodia corticola]|uniref:Set domain-containing protein n=1 Tax=Diplodia corticola TaxID=236234 RepID=A0A1J9RY58_9PEZI|nr:set domain-containing protein [Diplodia corticola]OJD37595.1 set domain-containing protein [Diplodia corticola]
MPAHVLVGRCVLGSKVEEIISHRNNNGEEQYLVRWATDGGPSGARDVPFSWHAPSELDTCLGHLQAYLESLLAQPPRRKKRKRAVDAADHQARASPAERVRDDSSTSSNSRMNSPVISQLSTFPRDEPDAKVYNGVLTVEDGFTLAVPSPSAPHRIDVRHVPTPAMISTAKTASTADAAAKVRAEVMRRLDTLPGPKISLVNTIDDNSPPLSFQFIQKSILGEGVYAADPATRTGCTKCKAHMGQNMGCEYSKLCDCLEYAAVSDTERMLPEERERWEAIKAEGGFGDTAGLPKKFPYYSSGPRSSAEKCGCLVPFYLDRRYPIYECNENCKCGPGCKTRIVQKGRQVRLEIFKTPNSRGWGLRCKDPLRTGQFIDTYRGEIITDDEATRREKGARHGTKDSYLYSLDKFAEAEGIPQEELYVIDGEFKGGPTRFINHSCEPNCRQYVVSYNRHDPKVYEIAFFAIRDIAPNEELTFDYLDKDEPEDEELDPEERNEGGMKPVKCLCGARKCRGYLWL